MSNPELMKVGYNNDCEGASSQQLSFRNSNDLPQNNINSNENNNQKKKDDNRFIIEEDYSKFDECTAMNLGPEHIFQKCYVCSICSPKKNYYMCKYCYYNCHQNCRDIAKREPRKDEFKGEKDFACHCGNKLKHIPQEPQKSEQKSCDLIALDTSLESGSFYCKTHQLSICCVCYVTCHKGCDRIKYKDINQKRIQQCLCKNESHTTYNEIALTFPIDEYQKKSGVAVWPIQILNILFNQKKFENLSHLFKAMLNNEKIPNEKRREFFPLLELFSKTFNRKFKTLYYEEDIINMFKYENLIEYIKNIKINNPDMILVKFRLVSILLFVHLKNDFQTTKSLTSIDFICNNILERIEYRKILKKRNIFNQKIHDKYNLYKLMERDHELKDIVINDVCNLMTLGINTISIDEYSEDFDIGLKLICFMLKKLIFTKNDLIKLINSLFIFFNKLYNHIMSRKSNIFKLLDLFCCLSELFLMISVYYNDIVVMDYLDSHKNAIKIKTITLNDDFIHVSSEHGNNLLKMITKFCDLLKSHYNLLNNNEEIIKEKEKKLFKDKRKMEIPDELNKNIAAVKLPENGGLFAEKIIHEFTECLGIFCLADNVYFKQIDSITKEDLINYYSICNKIEDGIEYYQKRELNQIDEKLFNVKSEIENKFKTLFALSYSQTIPTIANDINKILLKFSSEISQILGGQNNADYDIKYMNKYSIKNIRKMYIKFIFDRDREIIGDIEKINYFLTKMALKYKNIYPFLIKDSFAYISEDFVDNLIISSLDETITKILVFFSHRKYPNLLTYNLLDLIYSTLSLYFYSKRGMKYLLMGKILVRINKIFNRYDVKSYEKNINPAQGKTWENNISFINRTFDFCLDLFKMMKLYKLSIKNHKVLIRFKKNMLGHMCLFNVQAKENNLYDFLFQFKKMMKIFYLLSDDFEYEDFDQIKRQCVFIFKQNPLGLLENKAFFSIFNNNIPNNLYNDAGMISNIDANNNINYNMLLNGKQKILISLYFTFFRLFGKNTFYVYDDEESNSILNILYNFNDLEEIKTNLSNNNFSLKQKIILLNYLRTVYFMDHLDEYNIMKQRNELTTKEFIKLIKSQSLKEDILIDSLNMKQPMVLSEDQINELKGKYNSIFKLELVIQIYLNEIKDFPRQLIGNNMELCKKFYRQMLFDIKFLSNYFYSQKHIWAKFKLLFYELCLEFIPKIDIFRNVYKSFKLNNDTVFNIGEELYSVPLDKYEEAEQEEFEHQYEERVGHENFKVETKVLTEEEEWERVKLEAYKDIQNLKSISFRIYNSQKLYSYLNEFVDKILKFSDITNFHNLENYLTFYDETAEANFTPFSLLETLDYEYFYEEDKKEKDELIKRDLNLYKLKNLKDSFFETFIDINNTNFMDILTKIVNDNAMFDFNEKYVDFFKSYINSKEANNFHLLNKHLCILTKMLFYNSEGLQDKFVKCINDEDFFPNMNRLLNIYLVLVFSLSKNIYAYDFVSEINNLSKLIMQLLQALGEGFNTKYHNNIFKFQKDVPLIEDDNYDSEDNYYEESSDDDSKNYDLKDNNEIRNEKIEEEKLNNINNLKINKIYKTEKKIGIPNVEVTDTIYNSLINNLKYALISLDMQNLIEGEMPYDKLIITITNIFDFLIEYIESEGQNNEIIKGSFRNLFFGKKIKINEFDKTNIDLLNEQQCINILFIKIEPDEHNNKLYLLRKKIICFVKYKFANLLIYYLLTGGKEKMIKKLIRNNCSPIYLFSELIYNFKELLNHLNLKNPELVERLELAKQGETSDFVDLLINYYAYEEDFRNQIEFQVIIQFYILIKIFEEFYNHKELKSHYENIKDNFDKSSKIDDYYLRSKFSYCVYLFLEKIILKVEIRMESAEDEENEENKLSERKNKISKLIVKNLKKDPFIYKMNIVDKKHKNLNDAQQSFIEEEESESDNSDDESEEENSRGGIKTAFFLRPYLTFTLSETSKEKFIRDADRSNASQKYVSLVNFADYSLFEMVVNRHLIGNSSIKNYFANIDYFYIELVNYLIIILNNCFIIYHFYKSTDLPQEEYDIFDESKRSKLYSVNVTISSVQIALLFVVVIIWYFFEFINYYQSSVMKLYNKSFVFTKNGEDKKIPQAVIDYFQDKENVSSGHFFNEVNKSVSNWQKFYVTVFEASLFNMEITIYLLTIILNILFLVIKSYLFLVVEVLFIVNLIPALFDILKAIKMKYLHIILVLIFDFLMVYVFSWFGFFFFQNFFVYDDILVSSSGNTVSESYCYSSLQCYLFYISLGTRSNGGIREVINMVSYRRDVGIFIGRFFNDILFFLLINLFLGNVFLGIIIDTFGELRNIQTENENDRNNKCYICQLSSDDCLTKNINFDKHVNEVHNIWNYVYFLAYLHLNNPNNFNRVENSVWEKLEKEDYSWLPIDKGSI